MSRDDLRDQKAVRALEQSLNQLQSEDEIAGSCQGSNLYRDLRHVLILANERNEYRRAYHKATERAERAERERDEYVRIDRANLEERSRELTAERDVARDRIRELEQQKDDIHADAHHFKLRIRELEEERDRWKRGYWKLQQAYDGLRTTRPQELVHDLEEQRDHWLARYRALDRDYNDLAARRPQVTEEAAQAALQAWLDDPDLGLTRMTTALNAALPHMTPDSPTTEGGDANAGPDKTPADGPRTEARVDVAPGVGAQQDAPAPSRKACTDCGDTERCGWSSNRGPFRCEDCWIKREDAPAPERESAEGWVVGTHSGMMYINAMGSWDEGTPVRITRRTQEETDG